MTIEELVKLGNMVNASLNERVQADPKLAEKVPPGAIEHGLVSRYMTDTEKRARLAELKEALAGSPYRSKGGRGLAAIPAVIEGASETIIDNGEPEA